MAVKRMVSGKMAVCFAKQMISFDSALYKMMEMIKGEVFWTKNVRRTKSAVSGI